MSERSKVFWANVGRSHKDLQVGRLLSLSATTALCLLWTIPMTFIASLSSVEALAEEFPFIKKMIEAVPFIGVLLGVLAPLFVKIANALLPVILEIFSMLEGAYGNCHIAESSMLLYGVHRLRCITLFLMPFSHEGPVSSSVVEASLFVKLAAFMIIQTFFVSAVSGGLLQEISNIIENPTKISEYYTNRH